MDIKTNPLYSKITTKPKNIKHNIKTTKNIKTTESVKFRSILKENPKIISNFSKFLSSNKVILKLANVNYKKLKENSFLIKTKKENFYVLELDKNQKNWGKNAFNTAIIETELKRLGVNTINVEFSYTNFKKGKSYIAYDYETLKKLQTLDVAIKKKTITEKQLSELYEDVHRIYWHFRDKSLKNIKKITKEDIWTSFHENKHILYEPNEKKYYIFNPEVDLFKNMAKKFNKLSKEVDLKN